MLRLRQSSKGHHKLTLPWEGPYIVAQVLKPGTYKLSRENGLRLWATVAPPPPFRPRDSLGSEEVLCKEIVYR